MPTLEHVSLYGIRQNENLCTVVYPIPALRAPPLHSGEGDTVIIFGQHNIKGFDMDVIAEMTEFTAKEIIELKNQESDK